MNKRQAVFGSASVLIAALIMVWSFASGILSPGADEAPVIALVLDTDIGLHAATISQGAKLAAREHKAELVVAAPAPEEDAAAFQLALIKRQLASDVSAIMLVPASEALQAQAQRLTRESGVRLVVLDAGAGRGSRYVGTDHGLSGAQAVRALTERAGSRLTLLVLTADNGVCAQRLAGALREIEAAEAVERYSVVTVYADEAADEEVRRFIARDPSVGAILSLDGALSEGAARALTALGLADEICLVGFDCDQTRITHLQNRVIRATVLRSPLNIGYLGVTRALEDGEDIYTQSHVVDADNMFQPEYVKLVFPLVQ